MAPPKKEADKKNKKTTKKTITKATKKQKPKPKPKPKNLKTLDNVELDELFVKDSPLVNANLKTLIPVWVNSLPPETMATLLPLLPGADKSTPDILSPQFLTDNNHVFWSAVEHWKGALSYGAFSGAATSSSSSSASSSSHPPSHDDSFKDEKYEEYWGERLEKQRKAKIKAAKKLASGRGRGRGRGGKVQKK